MSALPAFVYSYSPTWDLIYRTLHTPSGHRTECATLLAAMPGKRGSAVSAHTVRANMHMLLAHNLMRPVYGRTVLTLRLTDKGGAELASIVAWWRRHRLEGES